MNDKAVIISRCKKPYDNGTASDGGRNPNFHNTDGVDCSWCEIDRLKAENDTLKLKITELSWDGALNEANELIEKLKAELERVKGIAKRVCELYGGIKEHKNSEWTDTALAPARILKEDLEIVFINGINLTVSGKLARECMKELGDE